MCILHSNPHPPGPVQHGYLRYTFWTSSVRGDSITAPFPSLPISHSAPIQLSEATEANALDHPAASPRLSCGVRERERLLRKQEMVFEGSLSWLTRRIATRTHTHQPKRGLRRKMTRRQRLQTTKKTVLDAGRHKFGRSRHAV